MAPKPTINIGLPIIESKEASEGIKGGDAVEVDTAAGKVRNITRRQTYRIEKYPSFMQKIIKAGGLINSLKKGSR